MNFPTDFLAYTGVQNPKDLEILAAVAVSGGVLTFLATETETVHFLFDAPDYESWGTSVFKKHELTCEIIDATIEAVLDDYDQQNQKILTALKQSSPAWKPH